MDEGATPPPEPVQQQSTWHRFLDGTTSGQRLVIALGGLAGALVAIVGLIAAVGALVGDDGPDPLATTSTTTQPGTTPPTSDTVAPPVDETTVTNQSAGADRFVRDLLATSGRPIQLNTKVVAPDKGSHVRLEYDCGKQTGCSYTRLEMGTFIADRIEGGVWFQGCYSVLKEGAGYGAEHLDLEFTENGPTCPA